MADLLSGCMESLGERNEKPFMETFCSHCRNIECDHAGWAEDKFGRRIAKQPDRMFNPRQADPRLPKYANLVNFVDNLREALRQEISDRRGDWTVPEVPLLDGSTDVSRLASTQALDQAARQLALGRGMELDLPDPVKAATDAFVEETKAMLPEEPESDPVLVTPLTVPSSPSAAPGNTPIPAEGIVIGGGPAPESKQELDPWAAPKPDTATKVEPGARIRLGGK